MNWREYFSYLGFTQECEEESEGYTAGMVLFYVALGIGTALLVYAAFWKIQQPAPATSSAISQTYRIDARSVEPAPAAVPERHAGVLLLYPATYHGKSLAASYDAPPSPVDTNNPLTSQCQMQSS